MKKSRINVMALLAIVVALSIAFVTKSHAERVARQNPSFYWFVASGGAYHTVNTKSSEQTLTGCQYSNIDCEYGYLSSQLKNPAQPSQGVKTGEVPMSTIRKN